MPSSEQEPQLRRAADRNLTVVDEATIPSDGFVASSTGNANRATTLVDARETKGDARASATISGCDDIGSSPRLQCHRQAGRRYHDHLFFVERRLLIFQTTATAKSPMLELFVSRR